MFVVHTILFLYIFISDLVILSTWFHAFLQSKEWHQLNGIAHSHITHILHRHCTFNTHISNFEILNVGTVRFLASFYHCSISFVLSNIKGLHLVYCVHGSAFNNISCLTFVYYCLPSLVLFVTFNSKESKFALTPNLHYLWFQCVCFLWSNHALFCKCNYM